MPLRSDSLFRFFLRGKFPPPPPPPAGGQPPRRDLVVKGARSLAEAAKAASQLARSSATLAPLRGDVMRAFSRPSSSSSSSSSSRGLNPVMSSCACAPRTQAQRACLWSLSFSFSIFLYTASSTLCCTTEWQNRHCAATTAAAVPSSSKTESRRPG